jgi:hypothetical protein
VTAAAARLAIVGRAAVVLACTALLPLGAPPGMLAFAAAVVAWQAAFLVATGFGRRWPGGVVATVDAGTVAALCVLLPVVAMPHGYLDLDDWARQVTSVVGVTAQWYTRPRGGALVTLGIAAAVVGGSVAVSGDDWNLGTDHAVFMLWQGPLSRCLVVLVARGCRRVDELAGAVAAASREAQVAAARRADVEVHMALLHDTVAATLTAASSAGVGGSGLRARALADLERLPSRGGPGLGGVALDGPGVGGFGAGKMSYPGDRLSGPPDGVGVEVRTVLADGWAEALRAVPADVVEALVAARDEALRNVERHAGTGVARVELRPVEGAGRGDGSAGGGVEVDVVDEGRGFDPAAVGRERFGVRVSIEARMRHAGGSAQVVSAPGQGTRVRLRWPGLAGTAR